MKKKIFLILLWALSVLLAPGHGAAEMQAMPESECARSQAPAWERDPGSSGFLCSALHPLVSPAREA
ncbi:MAG: hypothetical protein C4519_06705 [Desulfobacteraceae bacterium]|nr:MAG: hypothetical protein C4519_06705 [Desulfobacteraceae bacterium]